MLICFATIGTILLIAIAMTRRRQHQRLRAWMVLEDLCVLFAAAAERQAAAALFCAEDLLAALARYAELRLAC